MQIADVSTRNGGPGRVYVVLLQGAQVKWRPRQLSRSAARIHLQISGFGVIHVMTRATAGKEMIVYDKLFHRF
jgi:hypothetical protein